MATAPSGRAAAVCPLRAERVARRRSWRLATCLPARSQRPCEGLGTDRVQRARPRAGRHAVVRAIAAPLRRACRRSVLRWPALASGCRLASGPARTGCRSGWWRSRWAWGPCAVACVGRPPWWWPQPSCKRPASLRRGDQLRTEREIERAAEDVRLWPLDCRDAGCLETGL